MASVRGILERSVAVLLLGALGACGGGGGGSNGILSLSTDTLTFSAGMTHAHAVGVPVVLRAVSWLDTNTGSTTHTYRVSAVSVNLAESPFAPAAGVTG